MHDVSIGLKLVNVSGVFCIQSRSDPKIGIFAKIVNGFQLLSNFQKKLLTFEKSSVLGVWLGFWMFTWEHFELKHFEIFNPLVPRLTWSISTEEVLDPKTFSSHLREKSDVCIWRFELFNTICIILKSVKCTHGVVLLLVKLQASAESNTPLLVFFIFFKSYKWYQVAQNSTYILWNTMGIHTL